MGVFWTGRPGRELVFFFFQAEDGIRDYKVTGVQTCALPISFTRADQSAIEASGGSQVRASGVDARQLSLQGSGGSVLDVQGRADSLGLQMSGGTQLHGRDLSVKDVDVQASGGSEAELRASGNLRGSLSGGSEVHVRGGARTRVSTSGGSSVEVED